MNTSRKTRVGDVLALSRTPVKVEPGEEYVAVGIKSFGRGIFHYPRVAGSELSKLSYFQFPAGALALSNIKAWEGAIAVSAEQDTDAIASSRFLFYLPKAGQVDVRYLRYYFLSERGLAQIGRASPGSADRNRTLSMKSFESLEIELPDLGQQRRVAADLDAAMGKIDRIDSLHMRRQRLRDAFAESSISRVATAPDVRCVRLGDVVRACRIPIDIDHEQQYGALGMRSFGRGTIRYSKVQGGQLSKLRYFRFPSDALVLSNIKAWEGAIAVTQPEDTTYVASNRFLFYIPCDVNSVDVSYLRHYLLSRGGLIKVGMCSPGSADRNRTLSIKAFEGLTIPLPRIEVQRRVAKSLDELTERLNAARMDEVFAALRPSLLNAAFSGRL